MKKSKELQIHFIREHGNQICAAKAVGISQSALSILSNGYRLPSAAEEKKLVAALGPRRFKRFFGEPRHANKQQKEKVETNL